VKLPFGTPNLCVMIEGFANKSRWQFAKTMPTNPHFYSLRKWCDSTEFEDVVRFIRDKGFKVTFKRWPYIVYDADGWRYWTMGEPVPEVTLINRRIVPEEDSE
jgi:hypothetical protein